MLSCDSVTQLVEHPRFAIKIIQIIFILLSIVYIQGCARSTEYKEEILQEEIREELSSSNSPALKKPSIEIIKVHGKNFKVKKNIIYYVEFWL